MNAKQVFDADGKPLGAAYCSNCNRIWESVHSANRCCVCSYCGKLCNWNGGTSHPECATAAFAKADAEKLENAELVPNYDGPFIFDDRYYLDSEELIEHFESNDIPVPEFVHCSTYSAPQLDLEEILQNLQENDMHEDWEPVECELLETAIHSWNLANAENGTWFEDSSRKVALAALRPKGAKP